ncbi:hypothetical protein DIE14_02070 [Burkholderia sp. Bp9017]|nr:hypothetical protein DIE14_02070 [Burkholderia sp. Bp9017]RQZ37849.1 hypothetical protein DIE13_02060 [Burkholderia sp. Bp9016]
MPRETGKEQVVQIRCDEGVANHIGPEPCSGCREAIDEASVGASHWAVIVVLFRVPTRIGTRKGDMGGARKRPDDPAGHQSWHARTPTGRYPVRSAATRAGLRREGDEPQPTMSKREKSDFAIAARELANNAGMSTAERFKPSAGTKRNTGHSHTCRAEPGAHTTRAGPCAVGCKAAEAGTVHCTAVPCPWIAARTRSARCGDREAFWARPIRSRREQEEYSQCKSVYWDHWVLKCLHSASAAWATATLPTRPK